MGLVSLVIRRASASEEEREELSSDVDTSSLLWVESMPCEDAL